MNWLGLETNERKNLALWMLFGGAIIFTAYATAGLWLTASEPTYVFWLAIAAHIQIFTIMTGYVAQLVKKETTRRPRRYRYNRCRGHSI